LDFTDLGDPVTDAQSVISRFDLSPHPEGGWFKETWRASSVPGERAAGTAILYLLEVGQCSAWHRIDAAEIWHHYAGAPLRLIINDGARSERLLGQNFGAGQVPQAIVAPHAWQSAEPVANAGADWVLVGCTVSPGFEFATFEMAEGLELERLEALQ
jgi:predicted cupin superfamily sugar epimerase